MINNSKNEIIKEAIKYLLCPLLFEKTEYLFDLWLNEWISCEKAKTQNAIVWPLTLENSKSYPSIRFFLNPKK